MQLWADWRILNFVFNRGLMLPEAGNNVRCILPQWCSAPAANMCEWLRLSEKTWRNARTETTYLAFLKHGDVEKHPLRNDAP